MGNGVSNLLEVISRIETYDREDSIFAKKPWTEESSCVVLAELESGGVPLIAQELETVRKPVDVVNSAVV